MRYVYHNLVGMDSKSPPSCSKNLLWPEHGEAPGYGIDGRFTGVAVDQSARTENERLPENDHISADFRLFARPPLPSGRDCNSTPTRACKQRHALL